MTTYRVWNIRYPGETAEDARLGYARNITLEDADERYAYCGCGPDIFTLLADRIEATTLDGKVVNPESFDYREVKEVRMTGVEAVTFGFTSSAYGGAEEGGWYYDTFQPVRVFLVKKGRREVLERRITRMFRKEGWPPGRDSWALRYGIVDSYQPRHRPHYC